jgi:membrane protease YdiL (CAAX protease family)
VFIPIILSKERFTIAEHVGFGNGLTFYLSVVILAPVVEEVIFRYILRFSKSVAVIVALVTFGYLCFMFLKNNAYASMGISFMFLSFIIAYGFIKESFRNKAEQAVPKTHRLWAIYASV